MDAGQLDQRILIETPVLETDALGAQLPESSWMFHSRPWAKVTEAAGREFLKGGNIQGEARAVFQVRFREDMDSTARVTWRDRIFDIEEINGTRRQGFLWLHCRSVQGAN